MPFICWSVFTTTRQEKRRPCPAPALRFSICPSRRIFRCFTFRHTRSMPFSRSFRPCCKTPRCKYSHTYDTTHDIDEYEKSNTKPFFSHRKKGFYFQQFFYTNHTKMRNNPNNTANTPAGEGWERFREASQPAFETPIRPSACDNAARRNTKCESPQDYREKLEQELQSPGYPEP